MAIDFSRYDLQPQNATPTASKTPVDFSKYNIKPQATTPAQEQPETSFTEDIVNGISKPFSKTGGAILNAVMPDSVNKQMGVSGGQVTGVTGNKEDIVGYKDGKKLQGTELAKDVAGTGLELASYTPVGRGAKLVTQGVKGVAKAGFKQLAKEAGAAGFLQGSGSGLQEGQSVPEAIASGVITAVPSAIIGPVAGKASEYGGKKVVQGIEKAISPVTAYTKSAIENVKKAIPVTTLMKPGQFVNQPEKSLRALRVIHDLSPEITITRENGVQVPFNPKTADYIDTNEAVVQAKKNLFKKISESYQKMTGQGLALDPNGSFKVDGKETKLNDYLIHLKAKPTTTYEEKAAVDQMLSELHNMTHADGGIPPEYLQEYMPKLSLRSTPGYGNSTALGAKMNAKLQGVLSDYVDQQFEKINVPELRGLKDDYSAIKSVERYIFNEAKKEARKLDTSIASNLGDYGSAEVLSSLVNAARAATGDTGALGQLVKGVAIKGMSIYRKASGDRANFLRKAFEDIEKIKTREVGGAGVAESVAGEMKKGNLKGNIDFGMGFQPRDTVGKFAEKPNQIPGLMSASEEKEFQRIKDILKSNKPPTTKAVLIEDTPLLKRYGFNGVINATNLPRIEDFMNGLKKEHISERAKNAAKNLSKVEAENNTAFAKKVDERFK